MFQPEALKSGQFQPWSRGRGTDVWALFCAARDGDLETVTALVAKDPNLLECEFAYRKPLHFAVRENRRAVVAFLLEEGADPMAGGLGYHPPRSKAPASHESPLTIARDRGHDELAAFLESILKEKFHVVAGGERIAEIIRSRNIGQLREALHAQPDLVNAADGFGNQPIHWAVMTRQMGLIDLLLERGADINAMRPDGARPLDLTNGDYWYRGWRDPPKEALRRHEVLIGYLLARGAYYDISVAAKIGDLERVRALLDGNPALANELPAYTTYYSGLPLRCAAGAGHLEVVKLLLEHGANPKQAEPVAPHGGALREAIGGQHWEIVKLLLEHGADPNAMVESSGNCMWAAKDAGPEILKLLASYGGVMGVEIACCAGDTALVGAMLHANPALPIDEESVHNAIRNGHQDLVALILRYQPDILRKVGLPNGKPEFARWLIERGVDPNRADWLDVTPLHRCAMSGNRDLAAVCVEFGADIDPVDYEYNSTPLGWAARCGQQEMVTWLLERGASFDAPREKPWAQPIAWAKRRGHDKVVEVLEQAAAGAGPRP